MKSESEAPDQRPYILHHTFMHAVLRTEPGQNSGRYDAGIAQSNAVAPSISQVRKDIKIKRERGREIKREREREREKREESK